MTRGSSWAIRLGVAAIAVSGAMLGAGGIGSVQADAGASAFAPADAGPASLRRLNASQYKRAIAQIFGDGITVPGRFDPPVREDGLLAIGESHAVVTATGFEQNAVRAREIAAQVMSETNRANYLGCAADGAAFNDACAREFFSKYGRLLYRRPLSGQQLGGVVALSRSATTATGSFSQGIAAGLTSLIASPAFAFRIERSEVDPASPGARRIDAWTLAERISFLLWDAPPDAELLDAAQSGALDSQTGLDQQVTRLMASPKLEQGLRAFFSDMLAYDYFDGLAKDPALFPVFNPQLRDDAKEQGLRTIVDHLITRQGDYRDLFTTRNTFLSRSLGALYGVRVDYRGFAGGFMPYTFPADSPHAGLLTLPGFLMLDPSHEGRSSPTIRGKIVRENFLCQPVPVPPANINFSIVQDTTNPLYKTARDRLTAHRDSPACAGCHRITDPIGLALENYTPVGQYRTQENGAAIDASGEFEGSAYRTGLELTQLLHNSEAAPACVVQRTLEYGVGRKLSVGEDRWLEALQHDFAQGGYRYPALLREVATSPAFRAVAPNPSTATVAAR